MQTHEYRVVPAPRQGVRVKGARTPEDRFARAVEGTMNAMARDGWEFVRTDTLPREERRGLLGGRVTVPEALLVFRRPVGRAAAASAPLLPPAVAPLVAAPSVAPPAAPPVVAPAAIPYDDAGAEPRPARLAAE